ncbi:hypothetical protein HAX54_002824 [Datura stramonium]|uniref:Putative plant transposon protein domain-containing protein n=1 Tax=Datura stramonium TaxID=4076 RepID=A0ABS8T5G4_DATST|nr:hypothetical protein [Datura stramonium]
MLSPVFREENGVRHQNLHFFQDVEEKALEFYALLHEIGRGILVEDPGKANEAWVREFYANIPTVSWSRDEPLVYVRGRQIILTIATINDSLGLPNPFESELKDRDVPENGQWLVDTLVMEEWRATTNWGIARKGI